MDELVQLLTAITQNTYHYSAPPNTHPPYIVWQEFSQSDTMDADGEQVEYAISGTIDVYSTDEKEPIIKEIRKSLDGTDIAFYLKSVQYEQDTGLIHTEYEFDIIGGLDDWPV